MSRQTNDRVARNTSYEANQRIAEQTRASISRYARARAFEIDERLEMLDQEWDIERWLETVAPSVSLFGLALGIKVHRRFLAIPLIVQSFLLQHALQGWCPPLVLLRHLGIRTRAEIDREKYALMALRGDFEKVPSAPNALERKIAAAAAVGL